MRIIYFFFEVSVQFVSFESDSILNVSHKVSVRKGKGTSSA